MILCVFGIPYLDMHNYNYACMSLFFLLNMVSQTHRGEKIFVYIHHSPKFTFLPLASDVVVGSSLTMQSCLKRVLTFPPCTCTVWLPLCVCLL